MQNDTQLLKGVLEGCIMALLYNKETYGYQIVENLKNYGFKTIQEATVYPILNRLDKKGFLINRKLPSTIGPPRKYYSLTEKGRKELLGFKKCWSNIQQITNNILEV